MVSKHLIGEMVASLKRAMSVRGSYAYIRINKLIMGVLIILYREKLIVRFHMIGYYMVCVYLRYIGGLSIIEDIRGYILPKFRGRLSFKVYVERFFGKRSLLSLYIVITPYGMFSNYSIEFIWLWYWRKRGVLYYGNLLFGVTWYGARSAQNFKYIKSGLIGKYIRSKKLRRKWK